MVGSGEKEREPIRPEFDRSIMIDFQRARLRTGNVHSADGVLDFLDPIVKRYRSRFILFWLGGDAANQARLLMGVLTYDLLHMLRQFYLVGAEVKRSMEWLSKRRIKVGAKVAYHGWRRQVHVASAFPLSRYYQAVFG